MRRILYFLILLLTTLALAACSGLSNDSSEDEWKFGENEEQELDNNAANAEPSSPPGDEPTPSEPIPSEPTPSDPTPQPADECPGEEDGYYYVTDDPMTCTLIRYACEEGQEYFFDPDCGCGCVGEPSSCSAQDARGEGYCRATFGYAFNGRVCTYITGCHCAGEDCDALYESRQSCEDAYAECLGGACEPMDVTADGPCDAELGVTFISSEVGCVSVSGCDCHGDDCDKLYYDVSTCEEDHRSCLGGEPEPELGPTCRSWDADGEGPCLMILGYAYDGNTCVMLGGCDCVGDDCDRVTVSEEECLKQVGDCQSQCGDPDGVLCYIYASFNPSQCTDGSAYTVVNCEPVCVDRQTCEVTDRPGL
ncbi:MAG: hypothetical protein ACNA8W_20690 [Bradymonadaceae bacterium]